MWRVFFCLFFGAMLVWLSGATPERANDQLMPAAVRLVTDERENFPNNLTTFRTALAAADPDTTQCPQTWTTLKKLVESTDKGEGKHDRQVQAELVGACHGELLSLSKRSGEIQKRNIGLTGALACLFFAVLFWIEARNTRKLTAHLSTVGFSRERTLTDQIHALTEAYQNLKDRNFQQERLSLTQALQARKRTRKPETPEDPPPTTPPTCPGPNNQPMLSLVGANESGHSHTGQDRAQTEQTDGRKFKTVPELMTSFDGPLVIIRVEDVDLIHHRYTRGDAVLRALLEHVAQLLIDNKVQPEEIALGEDSVHWAIPCEAHASELQVNKFVLDLYRNSVFRFQDKALDSPEISVTMHQAATAFAAGQ